MSSVRNSLLFFLAGLLILVSCGGTDPEEGPVALNLTKASGDYKAGSMFVEVTASPGLRLNRPAAGVRRRMLS